jgi:membrane protease YdiL (CAAX protease family)
MSAKSFAWRAGAFVRSVLPAEPAHWLILIGSTLLYISPNLHWWTGPVPPAVESYSWRFRARLITRLLVVSGAAGYFLSFVPRKRQSYFPFQFVFFPAAIALITMAALGASWIAGPNGEISVIARATDARYFWHLDVLKNFAMDFGTAFWVAGLGFVLVAVFFVMLRLGRASLPIRLTIPQVTVGSGILERNDETRTMLFVWMLISLLPLANFLIGLPISAAFMVPAMDFLGSHLKYLTWADRVVSALSLFLLIMVAMGTDSKNTLRKSFRPPPVKYFGISMLIPATLATIWPLAHYLYDRIHWAAFEFGVHAAPQPKTYFEFPISAELWLLVPALVEEIAWRGFLQPRFIRRYGLARGILLVGIVWGAFHFSGDFHANMTVAVVVVTLVRRLCLTVAQSYVLAWLTIRSKSVLPAALAHGFYNIFLHLPLHPIIWLWPVLWAGCGWILFRYFPVEAPDSGAVAEPGPTLEPAT